MRMGDRFLNPKSRDYENEDEDLLWNIQTAEECRMFAMIVQMGADGMISLCMAWASFKTAVRLTYY